MLVVRDVQLRAFERAAQESLEANTAATLMQLFPARAARLTPQQMETFAVSAVRKALDRGLTLRSQVLKYAGLMFLLGVPECLAGEPVWVAAILDMEKRGARSKLDEIGRRMGAAVARPTRR